MYQRLMLRDKQEYTIRVILSNGSYLRKATATKIEIIAVCGDPPIFASRNNSAIPYKVANSTVTVFAQVAHSQDGGYLDVYRPSKGGENLKCLAVRQNG